MTQEDRYAKAKEYEKNLLEKFGESDWQNGTWVGPSGKFLVPRGDHQWTAVWLMDPTETDPTNEEVGKAVADVVESGIIRYNVAPKVSGNNSGTFWVDVPTRGATDEQKSSLAAAVTEMARDEGYWPDFVVNVGAPFKGSAGAMESRQSYEYLGLDGIEYGDEFNVWRTRGGPGRGFEGHAGRPGKVGGSLPENDWRFHGFSAEEFTRNPNLPMEQMPELGKGMSIVYSDRGNKARWVTQVGAALERFRNATGIAPQGITITDHLPWMLWHGEPYEVLANMAGAEAEEIANVLVRGHFATSRGAYLPQGGPVIYIAPAGKKEEGFDSETIGHELGHWLTMTAAPAAVDTSITPTARYTGRMFGAYGGGRTLRGEYFADLVESLTREGGDRSRWGLRLNHDPLNDDDIENRGVLMDVVRRNLVLRTAGDQPGRLVMVLMGDEIVAVPEAELDDLPKGAVINPLYLWWKEHFQPKVELDLDGKAFGWEAEDIAVQGEPEDGIFAVVEEVQRPKGRKETMAEAAGQEPAPVPEEESPPEDQVKSAFETILRTTPTIPPEVQRAEPRGLSLGDFGGLFTRFIEMLEKVRVPVVHVDVVPALAPEVHVHLPEQPAPVVNLTLPETTPVPAPNIVIQPAPVTVIQKPLAGHLSPWRRELKRG